MSQDTKLSDIRAGIVNHLTSENEVQMRAYLFSTDGKEYSLKHTLNILEGEKNRKGEIGAFLSLGEVECFGNIGVDHLEQFSIDNHGIFVRSQDAYAPFICPFRSIERNYGRTFDLKVLTGHYNPNLDDFGQVTGNAVGVVVSPKKLINGRGVNWIFDKDGKEEATKTQKARFVYFNMGTD